MDPAEQALLLALEASPGDWAIRLLVAEKMRARGATEECADLIAMAAEPPSEGEHLQKAVEMAGSRALPIARAYVATNPADGYAHHLLGFLLQNAGEAEQAAKHFEAARALGYSSGEEVTPAPQMQEEGGHYTDPHGHPPTAPPPPTGIVQEIPAGPVYLEPERPQSKKVGSKLTAVSVAILVHVLLAIIGAILVILPPKRDDPEIVAAVIGPPAAKQEMQKKNVVKQVKKSTSAASAAAPVAQLMRANAMAKFSLPKVTTTSTGPLGMGEGNLGSGGFGGTGSGLGSGASFFGGSSTGQRFAFILDWSGSMKKNQVDMVVREMDKSLKAFKPGVQYQVLLFAGGAFYAVPGWSASNQKKDATIQDPKGNKYRFKSVGGYSNYRYESSDSRLPTTGWLDVNPKNAKTTMDILRGTKLYGGTDWRWPFKMAMNMDPPPDVVFFMADGTGGADPATILSYSKKKNRSVQINMFAMETVAGAREMAKIAGDTKGAHKIILRSGKTIDGAMAIKDPREAAARIKAGR